MCLHSGCNRIEHLRGLCQYHYQYFRRRIKRGLTTWSALEQEGIARAFIHDSDRIGHLIPRDTDVYVERSEIALLYRNDIQKIEAHLAHIRDGYSNLKYNMSEKCWVA